MAAFLVLKRPSYLVDFFSLAPWICLGPCRYDDGLVALLEQLERGRSSLWLPVAFGPGHPRKPGPGPLPLAVLGHPTLPVCGRTKAPASRLDPLLAWMLLWSACGLLPYVLGSWKVAPSVRVPPGSGGLHQFPRRTCCMTDHPVDDPLVVAVPLVVVLLSCCCCLGCGAVVADGHQQGNHVVLTLLGDRFAVPWPCSICRWERSGRCRDRRSSYSPSSPPVVLPGSA